MGTLWGDRFEVIREIGRGARGTVYLATDRKAGHSVALKVVPVKSFTDAAGEIHREFAYLSRLRDPSLTQVFEFGSDPGGKNYFLVEEYFEGEPLSQRIGRYRFEEVCQIAARICRALQVLHQQGIYHGDLKPSNILVHDGDLKLVDFGLSRHFRALDLSGTVSGTIPYMAPELFLGGAVDGRSDLYSLGALLYELVSGHPPFVAGSVGELVERHLFEMPVSPIGQALSWPKEFGFLILRLLAKDPVDRFEEANDVIRALNLTFHLNFPLGPERQVLPPEREEALRKAGVNLLHGQAIRFYKERTDPESRRLLAEIYYRQGNWDEALQILEGLSGVRIDLLRMQVALKKGEFKKVREEGIRLSQAALDAREEGVLYNVIGTALYYLGDYGPAEQAFQKALALYERRNDEGARAALLNNLGNLRCREEKWQEAIPLYEESIDLCRRRGDFVNEGLFQMSLGYAYHLKGETDSALKMYRESEALLEAVGYRVGAARVKANLANLFIATGSLEKGEERLRQAAATATEKGDRFLQAYLCLLEGDLLRKQGAGEPALAAYRKAARQFELLKNPMEQKVAEKNIREILEEKGGGEMEIVAAKRLTKGEPVGFPFLKRILAINRRMSLLQDLAPIMETLLDSMIEFTGAERGYLILREEGEDRVKSARNMGQEGTKGEAHDFSSSLVERVLRTGEPIVTIDAMADERFQMAASVHKLKLRSLVCVPLRVREEVLGVVYLENRLQRGAFTEEMIEWIQAFADQASIAITNAWVFEELKKTSHEVGRLNQELTQNLKAKEEELAQTETLLRRTRASTPLKYRYDRIVGRSPKMMEALALIDRVTESDIAVFLFGESGTGKELVARAIHENGRRGRGPFVGINCSAIPETLLESELFGFMRGTFTGADRDREGLFEQANGGTLFLDEIGDMPLAMQAKLLRVIQEGEVRRIGAKTPVKVDVRIVSASNRDLKSLVREKKFREDLFFRVHGVRIVLPSLKERREDLPILVDHFLSKFAKEHREKKKGIEPKVLALLARYDWPGNIRELENTIVNACLLASGDRVTPEDLSQKEELFGRGLATATGGGPETSFRDLMRDYERALIARTLDECQGNITRAAQRLKVARPQLSRLVKRYDLKASEV